MEDSISLDHVSTHAEYDLKLLYENDLSDDEHFESPFDMTNNECLYYEAETVGNVLASSQGEFSLFCLNCQGLRAHWDSFCTLLYDMGSNIGGFDVIGVTELFSMAEGQCLLTGYHPLVFATRNNSNSSKGGVGVYIKDTLKYKMRHDLCIFIPNIFESIFIEINLGHKKLIIGTVYRPNSYPNADIDIFMQTMNDLQQLLAAENKETYLMGDMNIDLLKCSSHHKTGEYLESVFSHGFLPLITKPTRITDHSATLIDHIYANKQDILSTSGIIINDISDHFGVFAIIKRKIYDKIKQHETMT
jgi:predicted nucleotidyltransferase